MPATSKRQHAAHAYDKVKARAKARSAAVTLAGQDIGGLPLIADRDFKPARRSFSEGGFFCETYFPHLFTLDWSADHLRVISEVGRVVRPVAWFHSSRRSRCHVSAAVCGGMLPRGRKHSDIRRRAMRHATSRSSAGFIGNNFCRALRARALLTPTE